MMTKTFVLSSLGILTRSSHIFTAGFGQDVVSKPDAAISRSGLVLSAAYLNFGNVAALKSISTRET